MIMGMPRPSCDSVSRETGAGLGGDALPLMLSGRVARRRRHVQRSQAHLRSGREQSWHESSCAGQLIALRALPSTAGALHGLRLGSCGSPRPWWILVAGADPVFYEPISVGQIGRIDSALAPSERRPSRSDSTVDARPNRLRRCRPGRRDAPTSSRFPSATRATSRRETATKPGTAAGSPGQPGSSGLALISVLTRTRSSRINARPRLDANPVLPASSGLRRPAATALSIRLSGPPRVTYRLRPISVLAVTDPGPAARPRVTPGRRRPPSGVRPATAAVTRRGAPLTSEALLTSSPAARRRILDDQRP